MTPLQKLIPLELRCLPDIHAVGGCVRDTLQGVTPADIDLATSADPQTVKQLLTGLTTFDVGLAHGTIGVRIGDEIYEVTTFRQDVATDGRHAEVAFAPSIEADLARRDFTINAMAIDIEGRVVDPFGGQVDLERKLIRCVGDPQQRFEEDALRIVRLARFHAKLKGSRIDHPTWSAAITGAVGVLRHVSIERVVMEFEKAFLTGRASVFLDDLWELGLLYTLVPELTLANSMTQNPRHHPEGNVWEHTKEVVDRAPARLGWHALLHDVGKCLPGGYQEPTDPAKPWCTFRGHDKVGAAAILQIARRLRLSNHLAESLETVTRLHMRPLLDGFSPRNRRRLHLAAGNHLLDLRDLCLADAGSRRPLNFDWFVSPEEPILPVLKGIDLIVYGRRVGLDALTQGGPAFGPMLRAAFEHQIEHGCGNKAVLLTIALEAGGFPPAEDVS
jgi:tRNA nucleotidyltransferase/poly(A) polymerase